jgi:hypothetical protein
MFDREVPVGHADEHPSGHPAQFAHERPLVLAATDMLQHRVGNRDVKSLVGERQRPVGPDLPVESRRLGDIPASCDGATGLSFA